MTGLDNMATRNAWIREQLASIKEGSRILDAGAGELQWKECCFHLDYVSQDLSEYDGKGDEKGFQCPNWKPGNVDIRCDITAIPEPDSSFDAVLCSEVLDHVPDPVRAVQELIRLLRPGGVMLLTESFCGLTNQSPYFYYTGLSENFYRHWLKDFDLRIQFNGNYYEWMAQEIHRLLSWKKISQVPAAMLLKELEDASARDNDSYLVLCYGLLVRGIKH